MTHREACFTAFYQLIAKGYLIRVPYAKRSARFDMKTALNAIDRIFAGIDRA